MKYELLGKAKVNIRQNKSADKQRIMNTIVEVNHERRLSFFNDSVFIYTDKRIFHIYFEGGVFEQLRSGRWVEII